MKNKANLKGISVTVWARMIGGLLVVANLAATSIFDFQLLPYADAEIYDGVSTILTIGMMFLNTWKNTPITEAAQKADNVMKTLKGGNK